MPSFMLTGQAMSGWRDIQVDNCPDIRQAITVAEAATGVYISHGRGGPLPDWWPGTVVDAATGQVTIIHTDKARPMVMAGPPEVMALIAAVLAPQTKSNNNSNARA